MNNEKISNTEGSFKARKTFAVRVNDVKAIHQKFPSKVPVIVERYAKETQLPPLDKTKYLVPQELTVTQFLAIIRTRMRLKATEALYLLIQNRSIVSMSKTIAEVYHENKDEDGFLYITYASQEMFGFSEEILKGTNSYSKYII